MSTGSLLGAFPPPKAPAAAEARATPRLMDLRPRLSHAERDRRWGAMRHIMERLDLDALVFLGNDIFWGSGMANMHYAFTVDAQTGGLGLLPREGAPVVWNCPPHMNRPTSMYLSLQDWVSDIRVQAGPRAVADEIMSRRLSASRLGLVGFSSTIQTSPSLLHSEVVALRELLPNVSWVDATTEVQELRVVKSEEEIGLLREAARISRLTLDALVETAAPGIPDAVVYAEMIRTQIANGADPLIFNLFAAGPVDHPADELWHLLHGCEQPLSPSMRPLEDGDIIVTEWHTKFGGYRCHTEYTVYVGRRVPRQLQRLWDISLECLDASVEALTPGRTLREAWTMIREPARRAGVDWVELGFHAMGVASPEFPTVVYEEKYGHPMLNGSGIEDFVLQEGMTFGNNIDLHDSSWKPDVGIVLSDFMVVRPGGAECLVGTPREIGHAC